MAKEVVEVVKTIPTTDSILLYVYKKNQMGGTDYTKILLSELERAGIDLSRIHVEPSIMRPLLIPTVTATRLLGGYPSP